MTTPLTLLIFTAFCTAIQCQPISTEAEIRAARQVSNAAIQRHDIKTFASTLADDFVMIRGNGALIPSRQAYIDLFNQDFTDPKAIRYERIADKIEISNAAPLAAEHGHWVGRLPDGTQAYGGSYMAMWRRTEAGWKIRSELFVVLTCSDDASCAGYRKP
jgi:ketosteroid isomerase-like protein